MLMKHEQLWNLCSCLTKNVKSDLDAYLQVKTVCFPSLPRLVLAPPPARLVASDWVKLSTESLNAWKTVWFLNEGLNIPNVSECYLLQGHCFVLLLESYINHFDKYAFVFSVDLGEYVPQRAPNKHNAGGTIQNNSSESELICGLHDTCLTLKMQ